MLAIALVMIVTATARLFAADPFAQNVRTTDPLTPEQQQQSFKLPPGFEIQLVAAEPDINKPLNLAFDARGRLWVTTSVEYPYAAPTNRPGRDRLMIFEDFGPDGRARKVTEFAGGLNIPIGVYPLPSSLPRAAALRAPRSALTWKAIVWSIPHVWLMEDTDGDGKADKREPLYGPFDYTRDTHGNQSSFNRGFDGWLYATHGYNNHSRVRGRDGHEVDMHSGNTYRMRLDGFRIERHTWGQVNPFGMCFDPRGNLYSADCHSAPIYQLLHGGYYPSFGKPHDGLGFAPVLMEHSHGSTAISGIAYYADDLWPEEFRDNLFIGNVMTSRVNRDKLVFHGSTPRAIEQDDFVKTTDPWFRPVNIQLGPDGALYIADFYNRIIGHYEVPLTHPGRDRERGRIWRVVYTGPKKQQTGDGINLRPLALPDDVKGLITELGSPNPTRRLLAQHQLTDRFGNDAVESLKLTAQGVFDFPSGQSKNLARVHALWALANLNQLDDQTLVTLMDHPDPLVRVHLARFFAETGHRLAANLPGTKPPANPDNLRASIFLLLGDSDALVQRCAAEALSAWPAFANLRPLLDLRARVPAKDTHLLYVVRKAIRDQLNEDEIFRAVLATNWSDSDRAALADVAVAVNSPLAASFLLRELQRQTVNRDTATAWLRHSARYASAEDVEQIATLLRPQIPKYFGGKYYPELERQFALFKSVDEGLAQRGAARPPAIRDWGAELVKAYFHSLDPHHVWHYQPHGAHPTANPWDFEQRRCADGQTRELVSSLPHGEQLTGVLRSPDFELKESLSFWLCGHDGFPDKPAGQKNRVRLGASGSGEVLAETFPPRNDVAQRVTWDTSAHLGRKAYVEVTDGDTGKAYAWLAFGGFEPFDSKLRPPEFAPRKETDWFVNACDLTAKLQLEEYAPILEALARPLPGFEPTAGDPEALAAAMRAWIALAPAKAVPSLAELLNKPDSRPWYHERIGLLLAGVNSPVARVAVLATMKTLPARAQNVWAETLAGNTDGAEALLAAVESSQLPPRLLQSTPLRNRLKAAKPANWEARVEKLTADLPPANAGINKLLLERRERFATAKKQPADGKRVFDQNCAVCHQVGGQGGLVGPQLDGIGQRGLERVLEDILDPNRDVDPAFRTHLIVDKEGEVYTGLPRREEGDLLVLADSTGKEISIRKDTIETRRTSDTSLMPDNFGDVIPPDEFNHLLAYLMGIKGN